MDMMVEVFFFFFKGIIQVFWNEWFKTYLETPLSPLDASMFFFCLTSVVCGYIAACPCFRWIKLDPAITRKGRPAQTSGSYSPLFPNTASEYSVHVIQVWRWTRSHAVRSSSSIGSDPKAAVQQQSVKAIDFRYLRIYKASSQLLFGGSPSFSTFYSHPFFCGFILFFSRSYPSIDVTTLPPAGVWLTWPKASWTIAAGLPTDPMYLMRAELIFSFHASTNVCTIQYANPPESEYFMWGSRRCSKL